MGEHCVSVAEYNSGWNLKGVQFTRPGATLKSWAVISFDQRFSVSDMREYFSYSS